MGTLRLQSKEPFGDRRIAVQLNGATLASSADLSEPYPHPYPHLLGSPETLRAWSVPPTVLRDGSSMLHVTLERGEACDIVFLGLALSPH